MRKLLTLGSLSADGVDIDAQTRCGHYHGPDDVLAIRLACCDVFYACRECHDELADHPAVVWQSDRFKEKALLCGRCQKAFSIHAYLRDPEHCPSCSGLFNPNCRLHHHLYFQIHST